LAREKAMCEVVSYGVSYVLVEAEEIGVYALTRCLGSSCASARMSKASACGTLKQQMSRASRLVMRA
jgi:hypothetical protein